MQRRDTELPTSDWISIFGQAAELGVLQLHLTGGEPLARADIKELVKGGRAAKLYLNLITSGVGLDEKRPLPSFHFGDAVAAAYHFDPGSGACRQTRKWKACAR